MTSHGKLSALICMCMLGLGASHLRANSLVVNGSFEDPTLNGGSFTTIPQGNGLPGWTIEASSVNEVSNTSGSVDQIGTYWQPAVGAQSLDLDGSPNSDNQPTDASAKISQSIATTIGMTYDLTFELSGNPDNIRGLKQVQVSAGNASSLYSFNTLTMNNTSGDMMWQGETLEFTATAESTKITFDSSTPGWFGPALDNVAVTAVPTPSAAGMGIWSLGVVGAAGIFLKKRHLA